jgi:hypothetical protein
MMLVKNFLPTIFFVLSLSLTRNCKYVEDFEDEEEDEVAEALLDSEIPVFSPPKRPEEAGEGGDDEDEEDDDDDDDKRSPAEIVRADEEDPIPELQQPLALLHLKWWNKQKDSNERLVCTRFFLLLLGSS